MKNKLRTRRSADLYAEFQRRLRSSDAAKNGAASLRELAADAANAPAPRFYVSYDTAKTAMLESNLRGKRNKLTHEMYKELSGKVEALVAGGKTRSDAIMEAIQSPASSFFISAEYAVKIIYKKIRGK